MSEKRSTAQIPHCIPPQTTIIRHREDQKRFGKAASATEARGRLTYFRRSGMCIYSLEVPAMVSDSPEISVQIKGSGLSYSGSVTLQQAVEMLRIASLSPEQLAKPARIEQDGPSKNADITTLALPEVLARAKPGTSPETIAVIAAWIMEAESAESVTRADVAAKYREARLPPPGNLPRDFSQAVRKGFLASVRGSADQFYVTQTGRSLLDGKEKA